MKITLFIYQHPWINAPQLFQSEIHDPDYVFIGTHEIDLPDELIKSPEEFELLRQQHEVRIAEKKVADQRIALSKAKDELQKLRALPDLRET